jgi:hypothetical protein
MEVETDCEVTPIPQDSTMMANTVNDLETPGKPSNKQRINESGLSQYSERDSNAGSGGT